MGGGTCILLRLPATALRLDYYQTCVILGQASPDPVNLDDKS